MLADFLASVSVVTAQSVVLLNRGYLGILISELHASDGKVLANRRTVSLDAFSLPRVRLVSALFEDCADLHEALRVKFYKLWVFSILLIFPSCSSDLTILVSRWLGIDSSCNFRLISLFKYFLFDLSQLLA